MAEFTFSPLTRSGAEAIAGWRYEGDHAMYNRSSEDRDEGVDYMADPANGYFGAFGESGELVGFCSLGADGQVPGWAYDDSAVDVGAGMRPDLIGRGGGTSFLVAAMEFAQSRVGAKALRATIASWNLRARRAAENAGFESIGSFERHDGLAFDVLVRTGR